MALSNQDRVLESSTTTGTGAYTLAGAVTGFRSFSIVGNANTVQYSAWEVDASGNPSGGWENGLGTYTASGTTLARTTIYSSSNSNSAVNWSAGTRYIACSPLTEGTLVVRQPGGTVGTDEGRIKHSGTNLVFEQGDSGGDFVFGDSESNYGVRLGGYSSGGGNYFRNGLFDSVTGGGIYAFFSSGNVGKLYLGGASRNSMVSFRPDASGGVPDVSLTSIAPLVLCPGDGLNGGVGAGWLQNSSGEAALESAFTKSNDTLGNTNLSLTVIAGRSYRITGYLIVSNSVAAEGAKFDFDGGTATATTFDVAFNAVGGTVVPGTIAATAIATDLNYTSVTGTTRIFVQGYLEVNAGGTLILRASEDSTATGTMTLAAGSWLALYDTVDK